MSSLEIFYIKYRKYSKLQVRLFKVWVAVSISGELQQRKRIPSGNGFVILHLVWRLYRFTFLLVFPNTKMTQLQFGRRTLLMNNAVFWLTYSKVIYGITGVSISDCNSEKAINQQSFAWREINETKPKKSLLNFCRYLWFGVWWTHFGEELFKCSLEKIRTYWLELYKNNLVDQR